MKYPPISKGLCIIPKNLVLLLYVRDNLLVCVRGFSPHGMVWDYCLPKNLQLCVLEKNPLFFIWIKRFLFLLPSTVICPLFEKIKTLFPLTFSRDLSTFYKQPEFLLKAMILPPIMRTLPKTRFLFLTFHPKSTLLQILLSISKKKGACNHGFFLKSPLKTVSLHLLSNRVFIS